MSAAKRQGNFLLAVMGLVGATLSAVLCPVVCLGVPAGPTPAALSAAEASMSAIRRAEAYYQSREDVNNLREAIGILQRHVAADAQDYGAWWRIAKYDCYLARRLPDKQKKSIVEQGVTAGQKAEHLQPARPEGHYWTGVDEGLLAEARGLFGGLALIDSVRNEMEAVLKIDPDYLEDGAERVLGRLYYLAPFFKGGNNQHSVQVLEHCLKLYPENSLTMLYLADSYRAVGRINDARRMLDGILHLSPSPEYGPELAENQTIARRELAKYFHASL